MLESDAKDGTMGNKRDGGARGGGGGMTLWWLFAEEWRCGAGWGEVMLRRAVG